jgi:hypothetical protein
VHFVYYIIFLIICQCSISLYDFYLKSKTFIIKKNKEIGSTKRLVRKANKKLTKISFSELVSITEVFGLVTRRL